MLDEPTSGLSEETENLLFEACKRHKITCVTVGHRKNLKRVSYNFIARLKAIIIAVIGWDLVKPNGKRRQGVIEARFDESLISLFEKIAV